MVEGLIRFSIKNKLVIGLLTLALIGGGIFSFQRLPIDAVPDITNNQVQIVTVSPSLAPQEMEQFITFPVEMAMSNIQGVKEIRSVSKYGLSVVTVVFQENIAVLDARQLVNEQIQMAQANIPDGYGAPEMMPITTGLGEIFQFTLQVDPAYVDKYDAMELRTIQDWIVKRYMAGIPGIVDISSFGGYLKQYEVSLSPDKLRAMDISITEVFDALAANNQNSGGSYIEKGPDAFYIRTEGLVKTKEDIAGVMVKNRAGLPIRVGDIGEVNMGYMPRFGAMTQDGKGEAVGGITLMYKGANSDQVIERVKERIEKVKSTLPEGVTIEPYLDRADLVGRAMHTVSKNLIEGGLIVVFVLVLLLGNLRAGIIVASVIPLAMLFAFIFMDFFKVSANLMSLGAIDFGLVVDGAVIVVEATVHRMQQRIDKHRMDQAEMDGMVEESALAIRKSAGFPEFIILMVYLPILTLEGVEGKMFLPMAQTVAFAIMGALILSVTYVPMVSALFLSKKASTHGNFSDKLIDGARKLYQPILVKVLNIPRLIVGISVGVLVVSMVVFMRMGGEFIPNLEEGDLAMQMTIPPGSSLSQSVATSTRAEQILMAKFPEVKHVVSKIGTAEIPTDPMSVEDADIMIIMKDRSEWVTTDSREELVQMMKESLRVIPEASFEFTQPIQLRFNELLTGAKADVAVKIFGEDLSVLADLGKKAAEIIHKVPGAADVKVEVTEGFPQITVAYNRMRLAQYGLSVEEVNKTVQTAFAGLKTGIVFEGEKRFDLVVRLDAQYRKSPETLSNLTVRSASGALIPLNELATIGFQEGPMQVSREDAKRRIAIGINVRNRDVESLVNEIQTKLESQLALPPGYTLSYGGEFENLQSAKKRLSIAVPAALAIIFALLFFTFQSWKETTIIFSAVPMAAIGGVFALAVRGLPFSISAGVGFIALFGVAVLNGVVLIGYFKYLKEEGITEVKERIIVGAGIRLRPVLMTAAVASLGFLPMALSSSAGAEVQRPLATVVIGGLISSTLLTLFVLPALYYLAERPRRPRTPRAGKSAKGAVVAAIGGLIVMLSGIPFQANGQKLITMEEAEAMALQQNPSMELANLRVAQSEAAIGTAWNAGRTQVSLQRGEINAAVQDNYWSFTQPLGNPLEMMARKKQLLAEVNVSKTGEEVAAWTISHEIRTLYDLWAYLEARGAVLDSLTSDLQDAVKIASLRFETGESNFLSKISLETRRDEVLSQVAENERWKSSVLVKFRTLLNTDAALVPTAPPYATMIRPVESLLEAPPQLTWYQAREISAAQELKARKAALGPGINVGGFNQQLENVNGFSGFHVGLDVPLWFTADKAAIKTAEAGLKVVESEKSWYVYRLESTRKELSSELDRYTERVSFYETSGLPHVAQIRYHSRLLWQTGEIGYFEYLTQIQEVYRVQISHLDAIFQYNQGMLTWQFLPNLN